MPAIHAIADLSLTSPRASSATPPGEGYDVIRAPTYRRAAVASVVVAAAGS